MAHVETGPPAANTPRLLLVDDNAEGRNALARVLQLSGFEVDSVADGASALDRLRAGPPPDVVLIDMLLPDMDGREVGRAAGQLMPRPIIALTTGWVFENDLRDLEPWGIDLLFYKPLSLPQLLESLQAALRERAGGAGPGR
jgi:CheY-like chemotaxis protein